MTTKFGGSHLLAASPSLNVCDLCSTSNERTITRATATLQTTARWSDSRVPSTTIPINET